MRARAIQCGIVTCCLRVVGHVGDLRPRTKTGGWIAVALQTPAHGERLHLVDDLHLVDTPMAGHAPHTHVDVGAVVELRVLGEHVHIHPLNGFACVPGLPHRCQFYAVFFHQRVTAHARLGGRYRRKRRTLNCAVAVHAVEPHIARVQLVAERNGLDGLITDISPLWRKKVPNEPYDADKQNRRDDGHRERDLVRPLGKKELHGTTHTIMMQATTNADFSRNSADRRRAAPESKMAQNTFAT